MLCGTLHEDDLHQLQEQGRVVIEAGHKLMLNLVKVLLGNLVKKHAQATNLSCELAMGILFGSSKHSILAQLYLALFMRKYKQGHVVGARFAWFLKGHHEFDTVSLLSLFLCLDFLLLFLLFLDINCG